MSNQHAAEGRESVSPWSLVLGLYWAGRADHHDEPGLIPPNRGAGFVYFYGYKTTERISGLFGCGLRR